MSRYPLVDLIDRERDVSFRRHLFDGHGIGRALPLHDAELAGIALVYATADRNVDRIRCDDCEQYALSVGAEEEA